MDCIIPGANIKVVSKAVQSLSKIGDHLKLVPEKDCLSFRCLNTNKTAYCTINFNQAFFSSYTLDEDVSTDLHCNISVKALLGIFKHQSHKDNKPEYFKIELAYGENEIIFKTKYKYDIVIVRSLRLSDEETSNVSYNLDQVCNQISAPAYLFTQVLTNFQLGEDDFGLETKTDKVILRNYDAVLNRQTIWELCTKRSVELWEHLLQFKVLPTDGTSKLNGNLSDFLRFPIYSRYASKGIRSQLTLNAGEFKTFKIENESCITFSQKTFKAVINFAETFNLDVTLNFEKAGRPCYVTLQNSTFEANFLIATITYDDALQTTSSTTSYSVNQKIIRHFAPTEDETVEDDVQPGSNKRRKVDNVISEVPQCGENDNLSVQLENEGAESEHNVENDNVVLDPSPKSLDSFQVRKINQVFQRCYDVTFRQTNVDLGNILAADSDPDTDEN